MKGSSSAIGYFQAGQQRVTMYTKTKKNVARCRDSRTAKAGKQGSSIKQFSIQPLYTSFHIKDMVGLYTELLCGCRHGCLNINYFFFNSLLPQGVMGHGGLGDM